MSTSKKQTGSITRRGFVVGSAALIATSGSLSSLLFAAELPKVAPDDPTATALKYVPDASNADASRTEGAICSNCQLYTGAEGEEYGPCSLFPGKAVAAEGWCSAWIKKA
jgi:hypothetical protein